MLNTSSRGALLGHYPLPDTTEFEAPIANIRADGRATGVYLSDLHLSGSTYLLMAVEMALLLIPTCLMGLTLPVLARLLTPSLDSASRRIGALYGVNTLGAAAGSYVTAVYLVPRDIAVIGLGSGDTLFAIGGRPETRSITCMEIVGGVFDTLRERNARSPYGGLSILLGDPRFEYLTMDGRRGLTTRGRLHDIIEADALRPNSAYGGNLYSREYFELL